MESKKITKKRTNTANKKGLAFEEIIIKKLNEYNKKGLCYGIKIPNDWIIIRKGRAITSAVPRAKCFLDFVVFLPNNKVAVIEAKSTGSKTNFGLDYIKLHQYDTAKAISEYCDDVYYIICFRELDETYLVKSELVEEFKNTEERKSIPISWFRQGNAKLIKDMNFLEHITE